ncbi:MAG: hypothetical protein FOGNACKC_00722 [Anaerolineae bacterium]|nr:hypothetical protein [Anaerolineae bacterium]
MPNPGQELASIDFESMLGGPLVAVINAQAQSAIATVNFIKEVGFKKPSSEESAGSDTSTMEPIYVTFKYPKEISPYVPGDANATPPVPEQKAVWQVQELTVPILTILPIPFIRIDDTTIDFNAKINSVEYRKTDTNLKVDASLDASAGWLWGSAKLKVSTSFQRSTQQGTTVNRTYSMAVHIRAVQDEMPAGMERMLGILEGVITSAPEGKGLTSSSSP